MSFFLLISFLLVWLFRSGEIAYMHYNDTMGVFTLVMDTFGHFLDTFDHLFSFFPSFFCFILGYFAYRRLSMGGNWLGITYAEEVFT